LICYTENPPRHGRKASTELKVVPAFVRDEIAEWSKLVQEMKLPVVTLGK
jgi:hypothetical protein